MADGSAPAPGFPATATPPTDAPPPPNALPVPPELQTTLYESIDDVTTALLAWGRPYSLGFTKRRSLNYINGQPTRVDFACDRGFSRPSKSAIRSTSSTKTDCPWSAVANAFVSNGRKWSIRITNQGHNHERGQGEVAELATHRVFSGLSEQLKAEVASVSTNPAIKPRDIYSSLKKRFPNEVFTLVDIHNYRQRLQRQRLGGFTPTQALLRQFEDNNVWHVVRYAADQPDRITALFWSYDWCIEMWKRFPTVLQMDNTYKTNRFKMPFFQMTGVTNVASNFSVAFGLIDNEKQDGYTWLIGQFEALRLAHGIPQPKVVVTDDEKALKNALRDQLHAQQQLCIFHVNKNIVLNVKRKWRKRPNEPRRSNTDDEALDEPLYDEAEQQAEASEDRQELQALNAPARNDDSVPQFNQLPQQRDVPPSKAGLYALWKLMVYTTDQAVFYQAWDMLRELFSDQIPIIEYLQANYLP